MCVLGKNGRERKRKDFFRGKTRVQEGLQRVPYILRQSSLKYVASLNSRRRYWLGSVANIQFGAAGVLVLICHQKKRPFFFIFTVVQTFFNHKLNILPILPREQQPLRLTTSTLSRWRCLCHCCFCCRFCCRFC